MKKLVLIAMAATLVACGAETGDDAKGGDSSAPAGLATLEILAAEPANVVDISKLGDGVANGDTVAVFGRARAFNKSFGQMTLTGTAMRHCAERPGDNCKTPWDYCCEDATEVAEHSVSVEVHDGGKPVRETLEGYGGLKLLSEVVVEGVAEKDSSGNLRVVATKMFVK